MGTAFLLPLLFKTNVPQHEHNTCAPPCTNKFYIQYSIFYHHCQLLLSISDFETEKHTLLRHETSGFEARNLRVKLRD